LQQVVDEACRSPVGGRAEDRGLRRPGDELLDAREGLEARVGISACQVWECLRDALAGLAVRENPSEREVGVTGEQAQQLARHVARASENDCGDCCAHGAVFAPTPMASITVSARPAGFVIALHAGTFICWVMMSTPT